MAKRSKKNPVHYVDNKKFYAALVERKELTAEAESVGEEPPPVSYTHLRAHET